MSSLESQESTEYVLGGSVAELTRLRTQAAEYESSANWLLDQANVRPGARVLDVGCGPVGILPLLSDRVGPNGRVVGLEREPRFVAMARSEVERLGLSNVSIVQADALHSGLDRESFDFVHERLVLVNVPERDELLSEMTALTRPGGTIALEDIDNISWLCEPGHDSWNALLDAFHATFRAGGGDPLVGRRLPGILRAAGVVEIRARVDTVLPQPGSYRRTHLVSLVNSVRDGILASGLFDEESLDAHVKAVQEHLADPLTTVVDKLLVQVWGQKQG